ncbi:MAG: phosphatase PAP2 family protein [Flavobacteriales bacterium]
MHRSRLVGTACVMGLVFHACAQNTHELKWGLDAPLLGGPIVLHGAVILGFGAGDRVHPDVGIVLDRSAVNGFDRWATFQYSEGTAKASDWMFLGVTAVSLAGMIVQQKGEQPLVPVVLAAESFLLTSSITNLTKELVQRPRPYRYNPDAPAHLHTEDEGYLSFWSGHTANCAALTFTAASVLQRSDLSRGAKTGVWIGAATVPAVMGYLRVRSGKHFPTDVIVGYAVGAAIGWLVPYLHRKELVPPR